MGAASVVEPFPFSGVHDRARKECVEWIELLTKNAVVFPPLSRKVFEEVKEKLFSKSFFLNPPSYNETAISFLPEKRFDNARDLCYTI